MMKKIGVGIAVVLIVIQFFRIDKTNPVADPSQDMVAMLKPSDEVGGIIKSACYDCHSHETVYPWYANVAPVSWYVKHHVDEGREHLNFSEWATYAPKKAAHKLEECVEEVKEGEMPLNTYTWLHGHAKLDAQQSEKLVAWFNAKYEEMAGVQ